jgi:hypothetical protein
MYFLYKHEYRIFKPVEITIRKDLRQKGKKREDKLIQVIIRGNVTRKLPIQLVDGIVEHHSE